MLQADNQPGWQVQPASVQAVPGAGCEDREAGGSVKIWYNSDCQDEQNTGALCFPSAAMFSQSDIVGKAFLICGLTSQAVHLDNGSAYKERFVMAVIRCIYLIQNIINKHCYVGQTVNFDHRRGEHLSTLRHKKHKTLICRMLLIYMVKSIFAFLYWKKFPRAMELLFVSNTG